MVWPIAAALAVSLAAVIGSTALLALGARAERAAVWILSFAIGTLLGGAALHLLPEALEARPTGQAMLLFVGGMLLFTILERAIRWRHTHRVHEPRLHEHHAVTAEVLLWGDALHNFIDGIILGVAFSSSPALGIVAAMAVFAHEVPQEIGDFAVLLASGMSRKRALILNYVSAFTIVPGAVLAWYWSASFEPAVGWLLPVAAGGFVYIALADLVPSLHHEKGAWAAVGQIALMILGVAVIYFAGEAVQHQH
jgi:zinc and cadmium transporter